MIPCPFFPYFFYWNLWYFLFQIKCSILYWKWANIFENWRFFCGTIWFTGVVGEVYLRNFRWNESRWTGKRLKRTKIQKSLKKDSSSLYRTRLEIHFFMFQKIKRLKTDASLSKRAHFVYVATDKTVSNETQTTNNR